MNTDGYRWFINDEWDDEGLPAKSFTWNSSNSTYDWYDKFVDSAKLVHTKGPDKLDIDSLVSYLSKRTFSSNYEAAYRKPKSHKKERLPDVYEKGDLSSLLGLDKEDVSGGT